MKIFKLFMVCSLCVFSLIFTTPGTVSAGFMDNFLDALGVSQEVSRDVLDPFGKDVKDQDEGQKHNEKVDEKAGRVDNAASVDLVMILDKSGSMYGLSKDTVGGFNSMLDKQREKEVPVHVSVAMFNQVLDVKYDRTDIKDVKNLEEADYVPQGTTALLDAVGNTLSALKQREEVNTEGNKVLVVIITDGLENASKEWSRDAVKSLVSELQEKNGYEFVFLGAGIDAVKEAGKIGIREENSVKFRKTSGASGGVQSNFKAVNVMMDAVSSGKSLREESQWRKGIVEDK